jgi:FecR protein
MWGFYVCNGFVPSEGASQVQRAYLDAETKVVRLPLLEGSAPARLVIDDTHFLFTAHFKKSGPDLILTGDDGKKLVITNYFNLDKHPDLVSPDGAVLSSELVERLAGPDAPGQYAQAGAPAGAIVIGRVEIAGATATVQHVNGVVDNLKNGDSLLKGDVVTTGEGEGCTFGLIDGTTFNMGSNARMVLAELVYESNGSSNSALINLVKGSFVFVAGQVAHTGDMKVSTPVATMGIRGTTVGTYLDADINGNVYQLTATLLSDPGGGSGAYDLMDPTTGAVLHRVRSTATQVTLAFGANNQLSVQESNKSPAIIQRELAVAQILFPIFLANPNNAQLNQTTPQPPNNSVTPPQDLPPPPQELDTNSAFHLNVVTVLTTTAPVANATTGTVVANSVVLATTTTPTNAPQSSTFNATLTFTDTTIGRTGAAAAQFTVGGLSNGGNGTITFSDGNHANDVVVQIVNGLPVNTSVNLSGLADGPITATLLVTDPAGNTFHATATAQLDQDLNEHPTVAFSQANVASANVAAVAFVVLGLDSDDNGTITFSDGNHAHDVIVNVVNGVPASQTVNLSGMTNGVITATLSTVDPAGNHFLANASTQLGASPTISFPETIIGSANAAAVVMTVSGVEVGGFGTVTFSDGNPAHDFSVGITNFGPTALTITFTEDFSRFSDGQITATLSLTDPSGNQFQTTASVELDQDLNESPTVAFAQANIDQAAAASVAFAVTGLDTDDNGTITFSDGNHAHDVIMNIINGVPATNSVNLSGLTDGPITASLAASDPAGNHFQASASAQLDPDIAIADSSLSVNPGGTISLGVSLVPQPTSDDTLAVTISFADHGANSPTILAGDGAQGHSTSGGITTYTFSQADVASGLSFTNHGDQTDILTVSELLNGSVASTQTITIIDPPVASAVVSESSSTILSGTTLTLAGASAEAITFANDKGDSGALVLDHSTSFTGQISGFAGDGTLSNSDSIDLKDVSFATAKDIYAGGTLTVSDDAHTASLHFNGDYVFDNFVLASDEHGGTLVIDPPAPLEVGDRYQVDNPDAGFQDSHELAHDNASSGTMTTTDATLDQFHFGDMDLIGLNARASGLAPALSGFGSDHFQFAAMAGDGLHQALPIMHQLELDLHQAQVPLQQIAQAAAPPVHEITSVAAEGSPTVSVSDVIHAIHTHTT